MNWQPLIEEELVVPCEGAKERAKPHVREAWDCCVRARALYKDADYEQVDREINEAVLIAAESRCYYDDLKPAQPPTLDFCRRICLELFDPEVTEYIFGRAQILSTMLPLPREQLPEEQGRLVRRSISASTEFVALVESMVFI